MPIDLNQFRRAASILFGKLEMDVTRADLIITHKAHGMMQKGASMASIREKLNIPLSPMSDAARRRTEADAAHAKAINVIAPDQLKRRRSTVYSVSNMSKGKNK